MTTIWPSSLTPTDAFALNNIPPPYHVARSAQASRPTRSTLHRPVPSGTVRPMASLHVRLGPAHLAELDRRRTAQPIPPSRNAFAAYLLGLALDGDTRAASLPTRPRPNAMEADALHRAQEAQRAHNAARLKAARAAVGKTQATVADMAGVSKAHVARVEMEQRDMGDKLRAWVEEQERVAKDGAP